METIFEHVQVILAYLKANGFGSWQEIATCTGIFFTVRLLEGAGKFGVKHVRWRPRYMFELFRVIRSKHGRTGLALGSATLWLPILDALLTASALPFGFYLKSLGGEEVKDDDPSVPVEASKISRVEYWSDGVTPKSSTDCVVVKGREVRHGLHQKFRSSGALALQGEYSHDKPCGIWEFFAENGMLATRREY